MADSKIEYEQIILNSNKAALQLLKVSDFPSAKTYLDTCLNIISTKPLPNSKKLLGITLNNYGCYYKRQGLLEKSLKLFHKSVQASTQAGSNVSETFLNISNVLSQNSNHEEALKAAFNAIKSLNPDKRNTKLAVLAYKAMASEFKFLGLMKESQRMFEKAENLNLGSLRYSSKPTRDTISPISPQKFERRPSFFKSGERKFRSFNKTPELQPTDRIFVDFIPAPVSFDQLIKTRSPGKSVDRFKSITPKINKSGAGSKSKAEYTRKLHPKCKLCLGKSVVKRNRKVDVLTPVPRKYKMQISSNRSFSPLL